LNILIFAHDCGLRGAERVAADQAEALIRRGWKVTVVVPCKNGGLAEFLLKRGIDIVHVRYSSWFGPGRLRGRAYRILLNLLAIPRLLSIIRSVQPDVIHVHSIACGVGAIAARLSKSPCIWQIHETGPFGTSSDRGFFDLGERLSLKLMRWTNCRMLAVSSRVASLYERKFRAASVGVLYQAVELNNFDSPDDWLPLKRLTSWPGPKLLIVGAISLLKDQLTAVRAMPEILKAWPNAGLFLIGDNSVELGNTISATALELRVQDQVVQLGTLTNAATAIASADCCLVTSLDEGFGRVTIEAMLSTTPVIASDVAINREVAGDTNADFFSPSDPISLAAAVNDSLKRSERERSDKLTRALAFASQKFNTEAATDALEIELIACINRSA
jgi:glycosyltransferase involved in cell wall biosynthesis